VALTITSRDIKRRAEAGLRDGLRNPGAILPVAAAAGGALAITTLVRSARPSARTTIGFASMCVGAAGAVIAEHKLVKSGLVGVAAGGLWSLFSQNKD
jgi:hypothetical protein